jgi:peptidoglycan/LPS O-acetylase OafA/YrhL
VATELFVAYPVSIVRTAELWESIRPYPALEGNAISSRNQSLDVLRGVAILLVLGRHHGQYVLWHRAGGIVVSLFFVLSGFLISGLLFTEWKTTGRINLPRFFVRRAFKIYPAYYFFLLSLAPFTYRWLKPADFFFMQSYLPYF